MLSVLLHSSFRFSSSLSLCLCARRSVADDGVPPRTFSMDGLRPEPSPSIPGKPALPEPMGSRLGLSPLLYSAQRLRMVSSRCLSCNQKHKNKKECIRLNVLKNLSLYLSSALKKSTFHRQAPIFNKRSNIGFTLLYFSTLIYP